MNEKEHEALRREEAADGSEAERILTNPLFKKAIKDVEADILRCFKNSPVDESGNQPRLFAQAQMILLHELVKKIHRVMQGGALAKADVISLSAKRESKKRSAAS